MFQMLMMTRVGSKVWGFKNETREEKPPKIIKLTYSISIGIIQTIMILRKVLVKYNSIKFINHKASFSKLKLITEALDVTEYIGYMEGSIDFSNY